ncbi:MAG: pseudouridine synthase [Saprospiraceae bacterium]
MAFNKNTSRKGQSNFIPKKQKSVKKELEEKQKKRAKPTEKVKEKSRFKKKPATKKTAKPKPTTEAEIIGMRLNKFVARAGICSRRQAADYVKAGLVKVNEEVEKNPAYQIQHGDIVFYKDKPIRPQMKKVYLLMNKPKNTITTLSDDRGRKTVMDLVAGKVEERIFPVGRLDRATTGLLLLTNDGDLAKKLSHPSHGIRKVYHVTTDKPVIKADLAKIRAGLKLEDGEVFVDAVNYVQNSPRNEVGIIVHVGRNRIVRRIFEHLGYEVKKLDRTAYGTLTKKDLPRGFFRDLTEQEVITLKHLG